MSLNYQQPDPMGRQVGRYIDQPDKGDVVDVNESREVLMRDARAVDPAPRLETMGFECRTWPSRVSDFSDPELVRKSYYPEMIELVEAASGASAAYVFDHTVRESSSTNLNSRDAAKSAAPVPRVHNDYTAEGAPRRLRKLLLEDGVYDANSTKKVFDEGEVDALMSSSNYAFINVWRNIDDKSPVLRQPLAVMDERTVDMEDDAFVYELRFPERTGENYSLKFSERHGWYYYPKMVKDECLVFKVYDRNEDAPRFIFHTSFEDPETPEDAPPRRSIETRAVAFFPRLEENPSHDSKKATFIDMKHSNNAARVRLWLDVATERVLARRDPRVDRIIERKVLQYPDLKTEEFARINPLKKVPAFIRTDGNTVFESHVILSYLEDKWGRCAFTPDTPEERQTVNLMIRIHDIYVASPNSTQPGFSHSQGCMYLSSAWHGEARGMSPETRAAKLAELWTQVTWLDRNIVGDFLAGPEITLADLTWYPTCVFMEYLLPRVFDWKLVGGDDDDDTTHSPTPSLARWYKHATNADPAFAKVRQSILEYWQEMDSQGQFDPIVEEINSLPHLKWKYP